MWRLALGRERPTWATTVRTVTRAATAGRDAGTVPGGGVGPCLPARRRKGGLDKAAQPRDGRAARARLPCAVPACPLWTAPAWSSVRTVVAAFLLTASPVTAP